MARPRKQLDLASVAEALSDRSPGHASMAQIARRLGVAKPTLYRMAGSREELVSLTIDAEAERLLDAIHAAGLGGVLRFACQAPAGFLLLFGGAHPASRQALRRVENRLAASIGRPEAVAAGLLGLVAALARRAGEDGARMEPERLRSDFDAVANLAARISDRTS